MQRRRRRTFDGNLIHKLYVKHPIWRQEWITISVMQSDINRQIRRMQEEVEREGRRGTLGFCAFMSMGPEAYLQPYLEPRQTLRFRHHHPLTDNQFNAFWLKLQNCIPRTLYLSTSFIIKSYAVDTFPCSCPYYPHFAFTIDHPSLP